jgi:putative N6-adenine-specific DNA methylase
VLLLSGYAGFLDPMWVRNIPAEAAMIACNIPANINRKEFALKMARLGQ